MAKRRQKGLVVQIGGQWYVRYRELRNVGGTMVLARPSHKLGPVTTRGKKPPADILDETERFMATVNSGVIRPAQIVTIGDFVVRVYLPWIREHKRPSTAKGYGDIWEHRLKPFAESMWLGKTRTFHVQGWLDKIGREDLSRNTLKHIKSVVSGIFTLAKQQDYFQGENPARDTAVNPKAAEAQETYAYSLEEIQRILALVPEPAATAFAVAAFMGLRHGEIQGLLWEDYRDGEIFVSRSIWNGRVTDPKTRKGRAPVPVIKPLADRLEMHRLRSGNPMKGPMFANGLGNPLALNSLVNRTIVPTLNRCVTCNKSELEHANETHRFLRDPELPEWHGWHAARRGLGSNLYRLGVNELVIQRILRHANVSTTATYYIKTAAEDVRSAMRKLESQIPWSESQDPEERVVQ